MGATSLVCTITTLIFFLDPQIKAVIVVSLHRIVIRVGVFGQVENGTPEFAHAREHSPLLTLRPGGTAIELPDIKAQTVMASAFVLTNGRVSRLCKVRGGRRTSGCWVWQQRKRALIHLNNPSTIRTFDIMPDERRLYSISCAKAPTSY